MSWAKLSGWLNQLIKFWLAQSHNLASQLVASWVVATLLPCALSLTHSPFSCNINLYINVWRYRSCIFFWQGCCMRYFCVQQWQSVLDGHIARQDNQKAGFNFLVGISCDNTHTGQALDSYIIDRLADTRKSGWSGPLIEVRFTQERSWLIKIYFWFLRRQWINQSVHDNTMNSHLTKMTRMMTCIDMVLNEW